MSLRFTVMLILVGVIGWAPPATAQNVADPFAPIFPTAQFDAAGYVRQQIKDGASAGDITKGIRKQRQELGLSDPGPDYYQQLQQLILKEVRLDQIDDRIAVQRARLGEGWWASSNSQVREPIQEQVSRLEQEKSRLRKDVQKIVEAMNEIDEKARADGLRQPILR